MRRPFHLTMALAMLVLVPSGHAAEVVMSTNQTFLVAHGLATQVQYAEAVAPQSDWNYMTPVQNDPDLWRYVGRLSYHNYGTADPYRTYLRGYAKAHGLTTAQTEMGNPTFDDLYSDLTLGGVTYWEVAYSASATLVPNAGLTGFTPSSTDPNTAASYFHLTGIVPQGPDRLLTWQSGAGKTNVVQAASAPDTSFTNVSPSILMLGSTTNYLDLGATTNFSARFYRVKVVP